MRNMFAIISISLLSGCSVLTGISSDYPAGWPALTFVAPTGECLDLSGRYQNLAISSFLPRTGAHSLAFQLIEEAQAVDEVILAQTSNTLRVEALRSEVMVSEVLLLKDSGDYTCIEGALVLPAINENGGDGTGAYWSTRRLYLRRAEDGALIGEELSSGVGAVFWLVPIGGWQTLWFQWRQSD